jgi:glutathione S-transferase
MGATLFVIPGSHPSMTARLMLEHKGIDYRRVDLVPSVHRAVVRAVGFPGVTVPALRYDGQRLQGSRTIARALDALRPEPLLFPLDRERREAVERAEAWGDEVLQPAPRRLVWAALKRDRSTMGSFLEGARLGVPTALAVRAAAPVVSMSARFNRVSDQAVRRDLEALPAMLSRVDEWMEQGVVGGPERNAADFQIAPSLRLLMCFDDLRPALEGRPAGRLALEVVPDFPGRLPPTFPPGWLELPGEPQRATA